MADKVKVFISSTMKDLAYERRAVIQRVLLFNFEPVNAEGWLPNGLKIWARIEEELLSSHLVVLVLGERYGWIPDKGPGAEEGLSVTHMEIAAARSAKIPILPFLKRLDYEGPRDTDEVRKRDAFREEVKGWDSGFGTTEFDWDDDLAEKVGKALVGVLSESFLKERVRIRDKSTIALAPEATPAPRNEPISLDPELVEALRQKRAVLLAGAGMSLSAGYPGAHALSELLIAAAMDRGATGVNLGLTGSIQEIAENFEVVYGRFALLEQLQSALSPPQAVRPTPAHHLALGLFRTVLTTNLDGLFESACQESRLEYSEITDDTEVPPPSDRRAIIKIAGSISRPDSVVITTHDAWHLSSKKPRLWHSLSELLDTCPLVVVGHSLRDISVKALIEARRSSLPGYIVANEMGSFDALRFQRLGLKPVVCDADTFFRACSAAIEPS